MKKVYGEAVHYMKTFAITDIGMCRKMNQDCCYTFICFCIVLISSAPMIILGIIQYNSKKPVGFWAGKEPPGEEQVSDIRAYKKDYEKLYLVFKTIYNIKERSEKNVFTS